MFRSCQELLEKICMGEDSYLELREVVESGGRIAGLRQDSIANEIAAFANGSGGVMVFGVRDSDRAVIGVSLDCLDSVEDLIRQSCQDSIRPPIVPSIERVMLSSGDGSSVAVIRVDVPRSLFVHNSPDGYLHRVGSSKRTMPPDYLARLFQQRSQSQLIQFDESAVSRSALTDLDDKLTDRFLPREYSGSRANMLRKLAIAATDHRDVVRPTVAGILMCGEHPQEFLPSAFVQAVAYRGNQVLDDGSTYQLDAKDIAGTLDSQIEQAVKFVQQNMKIAARKMPAGGRVDLPQYDLLAVFEAVTNAIAHRDYSVPGSKIRLRMFSDRLELFSPGMLPNTMTPESLPYRQVSRNEAITSLLARCPITNPEVSEHRGRMMDKRGEGVPIILNRSEKISGRSPVYELVDGAELKLTIFAANHE